MAVSLARATGGQFAGLGRALEHAGMGAGFGEFDLHLIAAFRRELHDDFIRLRAEVAVGIFHAEIHRVARLDLVGRTELRNPLVRHSSGLASFWSCDVMVCSFSSTIRLLEMSNSPSEAMRISTSESGTRWNSFLKSSG